jgi:hypothetical protein
VLCKDFLTDALWATFNTDYAHIYGFEYNPAEHPLISLDPVLILARNRQVNDAEFEQQIQNACKFINLVEVKLKFELATVEKVEHKQGGSVWLFTLDKRWIHAPPMISMLSLFLRVGTFYNGKGRLHDAIRMFKKSADNLHDNYDDDFYDEDDGEVQVNDASYLKRSRSLRLLILKKGIKIFKEKIEDNYPHEDIHTVHNQWGVCGAGKHKSFQTLWDLKGLETIGKKKKKATKKKVGKKKAKKKVAKKKAKKKVGKATKAPF